ncbi:MAG: acetylglutamate kinase, partial [Actinomycetota bacterium]|nr:acetylglutamate kinase [Actinomycetota bacterium]
MDKEKGVPLKAKVLMEVLPYIKEHRGKTIIIKCGGRVLDDPEVRKGFASDVVLMRYVGINPVVVHGGAPQITEYMRKLSLDVNFLDGQRITDEGAVEVARMVLVGKVNQELVTLINEHGTLA